MRRDDILSLKEQRASTHKLMLDKFAVAEGESREFTAEESAEYDKLEGEFRSLTDRWEKAEELYKVDKEVKKSLDTPIDFRISDSDDVPMTLSEFRKKTLPQPQQDSPEYRSAFYHFLTAGSEKEMDVEEKRVLSKASAGAGLNIVPTAFYNQIIDILRFTGPIQELATIIPTDSGETMQIPSVSAHGVAAWRSENAAIATSDVTFGQASLSAYSAARSVYVSRELLTDSAFPLEAYLSNELAQSIGVLEETAFAIGDGTGKPLGLATAANGVTVSTAAVGNSTSFTYSALAAFMFALPYQYRRNAVWIFADTSVRNLYTMVDGQSRPLWNVNVSSTGPDTFLGRPIYTSPDLAAPAASAKSGIFGDIAQTYMIRRVNGFRLQRLDELAALNAQVVFIGEERVDGRVRNASASIVLQHSAT